ncbi:glutamine--fructose-6-phosphate transaminase (isomerizing) [Arthrobacter psychrochitiniphilus]|uniref:Glutamine--fructose-6-phosphate aminotransferase [isomerizing] n=1 Tax=Arthrobacter psychrochitiniphilus TaxID=291045 RepID=A0A2V3DUJ7_9MICC|nr:glutamine--fructose-6-phosphate transaminase (isomerizing) [Arthrobacter psychrochitiniphilus]NYG18660.1 glucosamine--fructose-6-phosphate aminotransferase (isomerizing) [Arthrobacter psychrochitiniphilus]PXA66402.1 glutamine--fructose-6-phosphate transaminase (isomerizing) [Arthrobacter psychrochitiniphilus]
MCGIVGYAGTAPAQSTAASAGQRALEVIVEGLRRLEYRGYDSAGIAVVGADGIAMRKKSGKLVKLLEELALHPLPAATAGIGHTRWATHGGPTDANAHPHVVGGGSLAVVHNGIIENYSGLKADLLERGHSFASETDSEVAATLLGEIYASLGADGGDADGAADGPVAGGGRLASAMRLVGQQLDGAFTLVATHVAEPGVVVAARRNSPLVVGLGDGENFLGSDVSGFIDYTRRAVELGQNQVVSITGTSVEITDFYGTPAQGREYLVDWDSAAAEKGGYPSFMEKEINDQPDAVAQTLLGRTNGEGVLTLDELRVDPSVLKSINRIIVLACGTSAYAGQVARYAIEHWCRIPTEVELSHEFRYRDPIVDERTLVVSISQSGETMDTLMAVRYAKEQGAVTVSICNTNGSTIPRESDAVLYTHAGPEIAVASTKAFLAQITATYLLGLYLAQLRGNLFQGQIKDILAELAKTPAKIARVLENAEQVKELARSMAETRTVLFLGRHVGYPVAMEGALKLKELAYIHAEGFAAGELKHGPIALIEEGQPVIVVVPSPRGRDSLHAKVVSNIQEVRARGAKTIVIAEEGDESVREHAEHVFYIPETSTLLAPLLATVPLQIFALELATAKGYDVDQPRNLAKSVTVE